MYLKCKAQSLWGQKTCVKGQLIKIPMGGVVKVDPKYGEILKTISYWHVLDTQELMALGLLEDQPKPPKAPETPPEEPENTEEPDSEEPDDSIDQAPPSLDSLFNT